MLLILNAAWSHLSNCEVVYIICLYDAVSRHSEICVSMWKLVSKQNSQVVTLTWCLDRLAHTSCIFLWDLNSS